MSTQDHTFPQDAAAPAKFDDLRADGVMDGTDLNLDVIREHPYDPHAYLNVHAEGWERRLGTGRPGAAASSPGGE